MGKNPETKITKRWRDTMEDMGAHVIKLSDQFTRGVPDACVTTNRVVMTEVKVDRDGKWNREQTTYKSLGLKGSQDHHIRQICRRVRDGACVVTDTVDGGHLCVWLPVDPEHEGEEHKHYYRAASGEWAERWLLGTR